MPKVAKLTAGSLRFKVHFRVRAIGGILLTLAWLASGAAQAQNASYAVGTTALLVGPGGGTSGVVLSVQPLTGAWTATANATWLHLSLGNQSGFGSTNVVFSYDSNSGAARTGTLTIAGQAVTIAQAGPTYVAVGTMSSPLASGGNSSAYAVAVDSAGNVYSANPFNNVVQKWTMTNNTVTTLVSSGLNFPVGVAVDQAGNVYFADADNHALKEWVASSSNVVTLVSSGLSQPWGVALDAAGDVYIADTGNDTIEEWAAATGKLTTVIGSGLGFPYGVAVDRAGNLFIADEGHHAIEEWSPANGSLTQIISSLNYPAGVAVDGSGNVYIADTEIGAIEEWTAANSTLVGLVTSGLSSPYGVAVGGSGNVYIADSGAGEITELPLAFVDSTPRTEGAGSGKDALPAVVPTNEDLLPPFTPTSNQSWLTVGGTTNGVVNFSFAANNNPLRTGQINLLGTPITITQNAGAAYSLGTSALLVGPAAGSASVVLGVNPNVGAWTATTNATWLHLTTANQSGTGSKNLAFSFDANPGPTRTGAITIASLTLTVTQAASTYVAAGALTALASSGLSGPRGVALDAAGDVYIANTAGNSIVEWTPANNALTTLISGLNGPAGVAVDGLGNVYIADTTNNAIKERRVADGSIITLVSAGLNGPFGVAVDSLGNVYFADAGNNAVKMWTAANSNVTALVSSGLNTPTGVGVDAAGNVYIADSGNNAVKKWTSANNTVSTLVSGLNQPLGVAVDGGGNIYIDDTGNNAIKKWVAASSTAVTLVGAGLNQPLGVTVDGTGNIYLTDASPNALKELPVALVDPTPKLEQLAAGTDLLPVVLPTSENLLPPFAPATDQSWLTITGIANEVVGFSFTTNAGASRAGHLLLLGLMIPVTQVVPTFTVAGASYLEGPGAGTDGTVLSASLIYANWTATANASWLHLSTTNPGTGSTNVVFTYDANPGVTRTGSLTVAGQNMTITQAGSTYVAAGLVPLVTNGLNAPSGVALDGLGDVFIADTSNNMIKKLILASNTVTPLITAGLSDPTGIALDASSNIYIANYNGSIRKWAAATSNLTTLVASGLSEPYGVAVDGSGNVYIADTWHNAIKKWTAANGSVATLPFSGLTAPYGVALDNEANVYITQDNNTYEYDGMIEELIVANNVVTNLVSPAYGPSEDLMGVTGLAADGQGNIYFTANWYGGFIYKWTAGDNLLTQLYIWSAAPYGAAVDTADDVYVADSGNNEIEELPHAFVDTTAKSETAGAGNDVLPVVVPASVPLMGPLFPTSSQPWLAIGGVTNGVVSFSFAANPGASRKALISLLGQSISVTQAAAAFSIATANRLAGPAPGSNSVVLAVYPGIAPWTAAANSSWLHLGPGMQSGIGSTNVVFSWDTNPGVTRSGTLTIAGHTLTITQAGSNYLAAGPFIPLITSGLNQPNGVAVDGAGEVYVADTANNAIKRWTPTNNTLTTLVSGLNGPLGVAVDNASNIYIADTGNNQIEKWTAMNSNLTVLGSGLNGPSSLAVDSAGNVYVADTLNNVIRERTAANSNWITLVSGLSSPAGLTVDFAGNLYFTQTGGNTIMEWIQANATLTALVTNATGLSGIAVDNAGNVYVTEPTNNTIMQWIAASNTFTMLAAGLYDPSALAVDGAGNLYFAQTSSNLVQALPNDFAAPTNKVEGPSGGADSLPVLLPTTADLLGPFLPASDQLWLAVTGAANGIVAFSFAANIGPSRTAHIISLGLTNSITQSAPIYSLSSNTIAEGANAGSGSVALTVTPSIAPWTNAANASWLHLSATNLTGVGSTNVAFSFDTNAGASRSGTFTIAGQTLTINQAGASYALGANGLLEGANAGSDGVALNVIPSIAPWTNAANASWLHLSLANQSGEGSTNVAFSFDANTGATRMGTLTIGGQTLTVTQSGASYTLSAAALTEGASAGNDTIGLSVIPPTATWTNTANASWLHLSLANQSGEGSTNVAFSFDANPGGSRLGTLTVGGQTLSIVQGGVQNAQYALGVNLLLEGPAFGSGSVLLAISPNSAAWSATPNASWLHLSAANQAGSGGANLVFSFDTNAGATRSGTITIGGQTLTLIQAGSTYVQATPVNTLLSSNLSTPMGLAVDTSGNLYFANSGSNAIEEWNPTNNTVTSLVSSNLSRPWGVAVDGAGNVYFANSGSNSLQEWTAANSNVTTLVSAGLANPQGVALDLSGNVYFANSGSNLVQEWMSANSNLTTLVSSGLNGPSGVAVDVLGNIYFDDTTNNAIKEWMPVNSNLTTMTFGGLQYPTGIAVDASGNRYFCGSTSTNITKLVASSGLAPRVGSGLGSPSSLAVDGAGNLYIADTGHNAIKEVPYAFVDPTSRWESSNAAGTDSLPAVLSATANLLAIFPPVSSQPWLTISGITNGVITCAFTSTTSYRTGTITMLGQIISVEQGAPIYSLGTAGLVEGPSAGTNSVVLSASPSFAPWTALANASWLHVASQSQSGAGRTNVIFSDDANSGATRSGTLTIGGQTLTVTQAGAPYVAVSPTVGLVTANLNLPSGVAVDGAGNVYIADLLNNKIKEWIAASNSVTTLVSSGLNQPSSVAVDTAGNVYIADLGNNAIKEWTVANGNVTTLVSSGLSGAYGVAVDIVGNVYIADSGHAAIKEWTVVNSNVTTLVSSGLSNPEGVAVDAAGNVYIASTGQSMVKEWTAANSNMTTLVSSGLSSPYSVNVDGAGKVYIADTSHSAIKVLAPGNTNLTTLLSTGINAPRSVAVDGSGNIYIASTGNNLIDEIPYVFLDPTPKAESLAAGTDTIVILPSTQNLIAPLAPTTTQPSWLTVSGITNGVVSFSFGNSPSNRAGTITVLGQNIFVTQSSPGYVLSANALAEGPAAGSDSVVSYVNPSASTWTNTANTSWLHLSPTNQTGAGSTNVTFTFDANVGAARSGTLTIAGQTLTVTQSAASYALGATLLQVGSPAGTNAVLLTVVPQIATWTNTANASWLHLSLANQGGIGSTNVVFTFDANPGVARLGTLTVAGQALAVVQAGVQGTTNLLATNALQEGPASGSDSVFLNVSPNSAAWAATPNANWLHLAVSNQSGVGSANVVFTFDANPGVPRLGTLTMGGQTLIVLQAGIQNPAFLLGASSLLEGPAAGIGSIILAASPNTAAWTASVNSFWLHLPGTNQIGAGSTNVIFSYDANPSATRSGTLNIAGQILTVIQAGSTYVGANPVTTLVASGLSQPRGVAVDGTGKLYIADTGNNAIKEWTPANGGVTTLLSSGVPEPSGIAVDAAGNLFIASTGNSSVVEWAAISSNVTTWVPTVPVGLGGPLAIALDGKDNVYIPYAGSTEGEDVIYQGAAGNTNVTALVTGLAAPGGVAVDGAGNVYLTDSYNMVIKKWTAANSNLTTLVGSGLAYPSGVAVDGAGDVFIADSTHKAIKEWTAANGTVITLPFVDLSYPEGVAVDGTGNVYVANTLNNTIEEFPYAFVDSTPKFESVGQGNDVLPVVLPATENLLAVFAPTSDQPWLTITSVANGVVSFAVAANSGLARTAHISLLGQSVPVTQGGIYSLGSATALEGPAAGTDSVVLGVIPNTTGWTNFVENTWLHLSPANQSGTGSTNVVFSFDANPGETRVGALAIGGQTLTVTQAGTTYVAATPLTALGFQPSGLLQPHGVAVDAEGNVYISDSANNAVKEWIKAYNTIITLVSSGLNFPAGVAVDTGGNVYIADSGNNAVKKWMVVSSNVTTVVSMGPASPAGLAVDSFGNIYIADASNGAIREWSAASATMSTLVSSGLESPEGVAVDAVGNLYIADAGSSTIKEWNAANGNLTTLVASGLISPNGVAVDGAGNVYIADTSDAAIKKWTAASGIVATLASSGLESPFGVAVDPKGNVFATDSISNSLVELPRAYVDPTTRMEGPVGGNDALPTVLPTTENLLAPFAPISDESWLTISSISHGLVGLSLPPNYGPSRAAHIALLGQTVPVLQSAPVFTLGTSTLLEGPSGGSNSVVLAVFPSAAAWTNTANAGWLHLSPANQSGTGCTNVVFSCDLNSGVTRSGTLTVAGQTLTVKQAGSTYVAAAQVGTLVSSGLNGPAGVAVDADGDLYIADTQNSALKVLPFGNGAVIDVESLRLGNPQSIALDAAGDVFLADSVDATLKQWDVANRNVLVEYVDQNQLRGVAVNSAGNVFFTDTVLNLWTAATGTVSNLPSVGLFWPEAVAVDIAGNAYVVDSYYNTMQRWTAANNSATTLVSTGLSYPYGVAVDGAGNVYIADKGDSIVWQWSAASSSAAILISSGLSQPEGLAVDSTGNVYIADTGNNAIKELQFAFVDPTPKFETAFAGNDTLPVVVPATVNLLAPFFPSSDQSWLTITGVSDGVVSFAFTATTGFSRTAHIGLLGQTITVTQGVMATPPNLSQVQMLANGVCQITFTNTPGASFTVFSTTNLSLPLSEWTVAGTCTTTAPGQYQFTSQPTTNDPQRFYIIYAP